MSDLPEQIEPSQALEIILNDPSAQRWIKEVHRFMPVKSHFVLYGNIRDRFPFPQHGEYDMMSLSEYLVDFFNLAGYRYFSAIDPVYGISILLPTSADDNYAKEAQAWFNQLGKKCDISFEKTPSGRICAQASFARAVEIAELLISAPAKNALFFDYLMGQCEGGQTKESVPFIRSLVQSYNARPIEGDLEHPGVSSFNTVFWCCDRENDLPAWFSLNNPRIRSICIPKPDGAVREITCRALLQAMPSFKHLESSEQDKLKDDFVNQTDGMMLQDVNLIARFCKSEKLAASEIGVAAKRYKLGITDDPWKKIGRKQVEATRNIMHARVKGQDAAITKTIDILIKAQALKSSKPKGVLFFAGPTGTGKTELAKSLTEGLFADERRYIRFDMSEFNHAHSDQRLVGAPPGYIGYEAGGELTIAIKEKPFAVVLFDEIEKADPKILDKFLQILDEGQLTSGKGERVYFSESIIIFTSNLGMDSASRDDDYATLESKIRTGISKYFIEKLNRRELLGRLGHNIVIFDYIRPQVAVEIFGKLINKIIADIRESYGVSIEIAGYDPFHPEIMEGTYGMLAEICIRDLDSGGRGIGNNLESYFVNPLHRAIYDLEVVREARIRVERILIDGSGATVDIVLL